MAHNNIFSDDLSLNLAILQEQSRRHHDIEARYGHLESILFLQPFVENAIFRHELRKQKALRAKSGDYLNKIHRPFSSKALDYVKEMQYGFAGEPQSVRRAKDFRRYEMPDFVSQHLPAILQEHEIKLGTINKAFASKWLNDSQIVFGTKCNKLLVLEMKNKSISHIQSLKSSPESIPANCPCGIHSIAINPSQTLLATGGDNTNDLAIYELPTFDSFCVGEGAHKDWIFDMEWLDDQHIITGSRDSSVALWRINGPDGVKEEPESGSVPKYPFIKHTSRHMCKQADKVRALAVNHNKGLMGVLSMNAKFHHWDLHTFTQLDTIDLYWEKENVCVASSDDLHLFAIGSQECVTTLDHRDRRVSNWVRIPSSRGDRGIRSLSFNECVITIGTGDGRVLFYDVRTREYLSNGRGTNCELLVGDGWLCEDENYRAYFTPALYPNAIYTHCYDENRTRLFVAGGPLPAQLHGNYAGLFQ